MVLRVCHVDVISRIDSNAYRLAQLPLSASLSAVDRYVLALREEAMDCTLRSVCAVDVSLAVNGKIGFGIYMRKL